MNQLEADVLSKVRSAPDATLAVVYKTLQTDAAIMLINHPVARAGDLITEISKTVLEHPIGHTRPASS